MGATPPSKDSGALRRKDPSLDALRKQLLGRNAAKNAAATMSHRPAPPQAKQNGTTGKNSTRKPTQNEDESDDEGRGTIFTSKKTGEKTKTKAKPSAQAEAENGGDLDEVEAANPVEAHQAASKPAKRKATSYLDEILAEKGAKKKKKKKRGNAGAE